MVDYNQLFDKLVSELLRQHLELNPVMATALGLHEYDALAPRLDKNGTIPCTSS